LTLKLHFISSAKRLNLSLPESLLCARISSPFSHYARHPSLCHSFHSMLNTYLSLFHRCFPPCIIPVLSTLTTRLLIVFSYLLVFTARCYGAWYIAMGSRPSVHPSVTSRYCSHMFSNISKIISRLISLVSSLSADLNMVDLLQTK